jgi:ubiquinone/menaquinone biosynthesis C-methylase UbiE
MKWIITLIKRKTLECGVFEDIETARRYDKETRKWTRNTSKTFVSMVKKWQMNEGKVLDMGTATGRLAIEFIKKIPSMEVIGLDLAEVALGVARENAQKSEITLKISFKKGDAEDMPFEDNIFDLVISNNTLHLIKNPLKMFNEVHRVLKPTGRFIITDFKRSWLGIFWNHIRASYSLKEVTDLLNQSNLQEWEVKESLLSLNIHSKV